MPLRLLILRVFVSALLALAAPLGVTASVAPTGVRVAWQGVTDATQYLVLRAPNATTPGTTMATLAAGALFWLDNGNRSAAAYQVIAVAADGRKSASVVVAYQPPARWQGTERCGSFERS